MGDNDFNPNDFGTKTATPSEPGNIPYRSNKSLSPRSPDNGNGYNFKDSWTNYGGNDKFITSPPHYKTLPPGMYSCTSYTPDDRPILGQEAINVDEMLRFKDSLVDKILDELEMFIHDQKTFTEYGFLHRRGILLYGPGGGGKTVCVQQIAQKVIGHGSLVLLCKNPQNARDALKAIREIEPNRFVMCIFEDIDAIVEQYGEAALLSLLDGEDQIDHVLNIATTNYPEKLDRRLVNRPRRFDRVQKINGPSESMRRDCFQKKVEAEGSELDRWVELTEGLSFSALAELVISVKCFRHTLDEAANTLRKMADSKVSSREYEGKPVGFKST